MPYVDGYLLPVAKKKLPAYRGIAKMAAKIWRDNGALEYRECVGEDLELKGLQRFPKVIKARRGETVVFAWIVFRSRADRDRVNAKVMKDPRIARMMKKPMPFDCTRMACGGFEVLVEA